MVGGATAVLYGWRQATIDADLFAEHDAVFLSVQEINDRIRLNVEFVRPEDLVPSLAGSADRHPFIEGVGGIELFHYDRYAQLLSKVVRGFRKDLVDSKRFVESGMVEPTRFRQLVEGIAASAYARYPTLSRDSVRSAVDGFLADLG